VTSFDPFLYDPCEHWGRFRSDYLCSTLPPALENGAVFRLIIAIVPPEGFNREQADWLKRYLHPSARILFLIQVTPDLLESHSREAPGYRDLYNEVYREFGEHAVCCFVGDQISGGRAETRPNNETLFSLIANINGRIHASSQASRMLRLIERLALRMERWIPDTCDSVRVVEENLCMSASARNLLKVLAKLEEIENEIMEVEREQDHKWRQLAENSLDACLRLERGVSVVSRKMENLFGQTSDIVGEIRKLVKEIHESGTFSSSPVFQTWYSEIRLRLEQAVATVPVIGLFSSGKTTFFNHLLGPLPSGDSPLRTAITHNTALILRFIYEPVPNRNRVEFQRKSAIEFTLVSPISSRKFRRIRARVQYHPKEIASVYRFHREGLLDEIEIDRKPPVSRQFIRGHKAWSHRLQELLSHVGLDRDEMTQLENIPPEEQPASRLVTQKPHADDRHWVRRVTLRAKANIDKPFPSVGSSNTQELLSEDDWNRFQGSKNHKGFAESIYAEYLIDHADLFHTSPFLQYATMVDTPGLDSIDEHHDQITEKLLQEGDAFIVIAVIGRDTESEGLGKVFQGLEMITGIARERPKDGIRPKHRNYPPVYVLLNWKRRRVQANDAKRFVDGFERRIAASEKFRRFKNRIYVVDLDPHRDSDDPLPGFRGFSAFWDDFRQELDLRAGIKFQGLKDSLGVFEARRQWLNDDLRNQVSQYVGYDPKKDRERLERFTATLESDMRGFDRNTAALIRFKRKVGEFLGDMRIGSQKPKSFRCQMEEAGKYMENFNQLRERLRDFVPEIRSSVRHKLPSGARRIVFPDKELDMVFAGFPRYQIKSFKRAWRKELDGWPGPARRFLARMKEWFRSGIGEASRGRLLRRFDLSGDPERDVRNIYGMLQRWVFEVIEEEQKDIEMRHRVLSATEEERRKIVRERRKELEDLNRNWGLIEELEGEFSRLLKILREAKK